MVLFGKGCSMSDYIFGRNAVLEALESDRKVEKIYILKGDLKGSINKIIGKAKANGIIISEIDKNKIDIFIEIASLKKEQSNSLSNTNKKNIINENSTHYNTNKKIVPILGKVAAGIPITLVEEYLDKVVAPSDKADFATVANGTSMEPVIHNGENIFIKSMQSLDNGDIGVFDIDGETTCKRFKYDSTNKTVILTSFNSTFKPLTYPLKNYQGIFRIIGKVILTDDQEDRYHNFIRK